MGLIRNYDPCNGDWVENAVEYAKTVIQEYYSMKGEEKPQPIKDSMDKKRDEAIEELKRAYNIYDLKPPLSPNKSEAERAKFVNDRIRSALVVYMKEATTDPSKYDPLRCFQEDLDRIESLQKNASEDSNFEIYLKMYEELKDYKDNL